MYVDHRADCVVSTFLPTNQRRCDHETIQMAEARFTRTKRRREKPERERRCISLSFLRGTISRSKMDTTLLLLCPLLWSDEAVQTECSLAHLLVRVVYTYPLGRSKHVLTEPRSFSLYPLLRSSTSHVPRLGRLRRDGRGTGLCVYYLPWHALFSAILSC